MAGFVIHDPWSSEYVSKCLNANQKWHRMDLSVFWHFQWPSKKFFEPIVINETSANSLKLLSALIMTAIFKSKVWSHSLRWATNNTVLFCKSSFLCSYNRLSKFLVVSTIYFCSFHYSLSCKFQFRVFIQEWITSSLGIINERTSLQLNIVNPVPNERRNCLDVKLVSMYSHSSCK